MDAGDDNTATMSMTFDGWNTYKLKLLFDGWDVSTEWEFGLTCVAVGFFAVIYQSMRFLIFVVEDTMHPAAPSAADSLDASSTRAATKPPPQLSAGYQQTSRSEDGAVAPAPAAALSDERYLLLRLVHSLLSGLNYGLALLLMLMAMTYNPSIFVSLITGYAIGDFVFFVRMRPSANENCH